MWVFRTSPPAAPLLLFRRGPVGQLWRQELGHRSIPLPEPYRSRLPDEYLRLCSRGCTVRPPSVEYLGIVTLQVPISTVVACPRPCCWLGRRTILPSSWETVA